jgi:hypothetical protein
MPGMGKAALSIAAFAFFAGIAVAENLVGNPGFEDGGSTPASWSVFPPSAADVVFAWETSAVRTGLRSVSVASATDGAGLWHQYVPVTAGTVYSLSGYITVAIPDYGAYCMLQIAYRDGGGTLLEMVEFLSHRGSMDWIWDFPYPLLTRSPAGASSAEIILYLQGPGQAWFDDISFEAVVTGTIAGRVTCLGEPVEGALVRVQTTDYLDYTDENGDYSIADVPVSAPRYLLQASSDGYRDTARGDIDVIPDGVATADVSLERGSAMPYPELRVKFASLRLHDSVPNPVCSVTAVIDPSLCPPDVLPYLDSSDYIDSDNPGIVAAAEEIVSSLDPSEQENTRAVSHAIYDWIVKNYENDAAVAFGAFTDTTAGGWQTVAGEGWAWGLSFLDWVKKPSESLGEHRCICIEHSRFITALMRASGIPARPVKTYACQFWAQETSGSGEWIGVSTLKGRGSYRSTGSLTAGYESFSPSEVFNYALDAGPIIHEDWSVETAGMFREVHPWEEEYASSPEGLAAAEANLETFRLTGAASSAPPPGTASRYVVHYSDITIRLENIGEQRRLVVRFPFPTGNEHVECLEESAWWTNRPECVTASWMEETVKPPRAEIERWFNLEFDLTPMVDRLSSCAAGDYDGDGVEDVAVFRDTAGLWAVRGVSRFYYGSAGDIPVSGDYDGDGTGAAAVFRRSSGLWAVRGLTRFYLGSSDDMPAAADYNGDGRCEGAVFRSASSLWAIRGETRIYFGSTGDRPVRADSGGDGTGDVAIFRPCDGLWAVRGGTRFVFGQARDLPFISGSDASVFRPEEGLWAVRDLTRFYLGQSGDRPVLGGGIFRADDGLWAVRGLSRFYFGGQGDLPATR